MMQPHFRSIDTSNPAIAWLGATAAASAVALQLAFPPNSFGVARRDWRNERKAALILLAVLAIFAVISFEAKDALSARLRDDPEYPRAADLVLALFAFAVLTASRVLLVPAFAALGRRLVSRRRWGDEHEMRAQRFAGQLWKVLFHGSMAVAPLIFLRHEPWFAPLPGFGDATKIFTNHPHIPPVPWLREFYMVQMGYYLHAMFVTLLQRGRPNLVSMTVHHAATIALIGLSFELNFLRVGALVVWPHDATDVFVSLSRLAAETGIGWLTLASFICLLASWISLRLIVFPLLVIKPVCFDSFRFGWLQWDNFFGWTPFTALLLLLVALHFWWLVQLLGMFRVYIRTGIARDSTESHHKHSA